MVIDDAQQIDLPSPGMLSGRRRLLIAVTVALAAHLAMAWLLYDGLPREPLPASRMVRIALVEAPAPSVSEARPAVEPVAEPVEPEKLQAAEEPVQQAVAGRPVTPRPREPSPPKPSPARPVADSSPTPPPPSPPQPPSATQATEVPAEHAPSAPAVPAMDEQQPAEPAGPVFVAPSLAGMSNPRPTYPLLARRRGLEGRLLLQVQVGPDGAVTGVEVKESSGHTVLDRAAVRTLHRWRFTPAREGDRAVAASIEVPIRFQLRDPG